MGLITNNERYNQSVDIWTTINNRLTNQVITTLKNDNDGFNPVYMMLDSGARGSKEQIRQLSGMRGLMAKPQKSGVEGGQALCIRWPKYRVQSTELQATVLPVNTQD